MFLFFKCPSKRNVILVVYKVHNIITTHFCNSVILTTNKKIKDIIEEDNITNAQWKLIQGFYVFKRHQEENKANNFMATVNLDWLEDNIIYWQHLCHLE